MATVLPKVLGKVLPKASKFNKFVATAIQHFPLSSGLADSITGDVLTYARSGQLTVVYDDGSGTQDLTANNAPFAGTGIRLEEAHTNSTTWSRGLNTLDWTKNNCTISANAAASPDIDEISDTADKIVESNDGGGTTHFINNPVTVTLGERWFVSNFFKAAGRTEAWMDLGAGNNGVIGFELSGAGSTYVINAGSAGVNLDYGIKSLDNGWYYCWIGSTIQQTISNGMRFGPADSGSNNYTGNGTDGIYAWQADLSKENGILSPTETTSTIAATSNPTLTWPLSNLPANDFYIEFDWNPTGTGNNQYLFSLYDGVNGDEIFYGTGNLEAGGVSFALTPDTDTTYKVRYTRSSTNGKTLEIIGGSSDTDGAATSDQTWPTTGYIGKRYNNSAWASANISELKVVSL